MKKMLVILAALAMLAMSNLAMADGATATVGVTLNVATYVSVNSGGNVECVGQDLGGAGDFAVGGQSLIINTNCPAKITKNVTSSKPVSGYVVATDISTFNVGAGFATVQPIEYTVTASPARRLLVSDNATFNAGGATVVWDIIAQ